MSCFTLFKKRRTQYIFREVTVLRKVYFLFFTLIVVFLSSSVSFAAAGDARIVFQVGKSSYIVDNRPQDMDAAPFIENSRTYVPVRYLALSLGIQSDRIQWNPAKQLVTLSDGDTTVTLAIGSSVIYVDNKPVLIDTAPLIRQGRTYLPARYVAEAFGYQVDWDGRTQSILIGLHLNDNKAPEVIKANIDRGQMLLFHQNYAMQESLPQNIFTSSPIRQIETTITPRFDNKLINITAKKGDVGDTYICGLSPQPSSVYKIKCAYNSNNQNSEAFIRIGGTLIGINQKNNKNGVIAGYYKTANGNEHKSFIVSEGVNLPFELMVTCNPDTRSATIVFNGKEIHSMELPYWDASIRDLPYPPTNPGFLKIYHYIPVEAAHSSLDIFELTQETKRRFITVTSPENIQPFGLDGPHPSSTVNNGIDYLVKNNFNGTLWLDKKYEWAKDQAEFAFIQKVVKEKGWEVGIHYSRGLTELPFEEATKLMREEYEFIKQHSGFTPTSWCSLQSRDNVTLADWAYKNLGMVWRNGSSGISILPNVGNLDNGTWLWWNKSMQSGMVHPCFTHKTDIEPAVPYSIDYSKLVKWVDSYKKMGYEIAGFHEWWKINNNTLSATFENIYADDSKCDFTAHTNGEKALVNIDIRNAKKHKKVFDITLNREVSWVENGDMSMTFYVENGHKYRISLI